MSATPIAESQRLDLIDALRGFALAGVLLANLPSLTLYEHLPDAARATLPFAALDRLLEPAITVFVAGKFITLFSLLFGVGFSLQIARLAAAGEGPGRYARRLLVLLLIGLAHSCLVWWGDILRFYAVLGLALLPLAAWTPRRLAWAGIGITLFGLPLARLLLGDISQRVPSMAEMSLSALPAYASDDWAQVIAMNIGLTHWSLLIYWYLVFFVAGRLLLGAAVGKLGMLADPTRHARHWRQLMLAGLSLGFAVTIFIQACDYGRLPAASLWFETGIGHVVMSVSRALSTLALGLGYMSAFVLIYQRPAWRPWLQPLAPVGRMALSNYLLQSLVGVAVFYGVGLGIGPRFGLVGVVAAWLLLFALQIVASRWWLAHFRFGPMEWLWRSLTYGQAQAMRR